MRHALRFLVLPTCTQPTFKKPQRVVPERVDLDRFSAPWRHHPIVHFRVHPGQLIAFLPLRKQTVHRVDMNAEVCAAQMMPNDIDKLRKHLLQQMCIS